MTKPEGKAKLKPLEPKKDNVKVQADRSPKAEPKGKDGKDGNLEPKKIAAAAPPTADIKISKAPPTSTPEKKAIDGTTVAKATTQINADGGGLLDQTKMLTGGLSTAVAVQDDLNEGESRRDGLINFVFVLTLAAFTFVGLGACLGMYARTVDKSEDFCDVYNKANSTSECQFLAMFLCVERNATTDAVRCNETESIECNSSSNATSVSTGTDEDIESVLDADLHSNGSTTMNQFHACVKKMPSLKAPLQYDDAFVFVVTVITTIGYGHIVPGEMAPQVAMVIYAFLVTELFMRFLDELAFWMRDKIAVWYHRAIQRHLGKKKTAPGANASTKKGAGGGAGAGGEQGGGSGGILTYCPDLIPFTILFAIVTLYQCCVAAIFLKAESKVFEDEFERAYYFVFISVSMIGFGDIVPDERAQMASMIGILFGSLLMWLCLIVLDEWIRNSFGRLVDWVSGRKEQRFDMLTLEEMMMDAEGGMQPTMAHPPAAYRPLLTVLLQPSMPARPPPLRTILQPTMARPPLRTMFLQSQMQQPGGGGGGVMKMPQTILMRTQFRAGRFNRAVGNDYMDDDDD